MVYTPFILKMTEQYRPKILFFKMSVNKICYLYIFTLYENISFDNIIGYNTIQQLINLIYNSPFIILEISVFGTFCTQKYL